MAISKVKQQEERRIQDRRVQQRRAFKSRYVFIDRLFKFLFVSIIILMGVWIYIFRS
ncbi:MAG: hypothetical protein HOJ79_01380 [Nitrospina sp.]|nr:hypothetical protein [Nitrospina sp.]